MLECVSEQLSQLDSSCLTNLENIDTLPIIYDAYVFDSKQGIQSKIQTIVNEIFKEIKELLNLKKSINEFRKLEIDISFFTYLLYYKTSAFNRAPGVTIKWSNKTLLSVLKATISKSKDVPDRTLNIFINCLHVTSLLKDSTISDSYDIISFLINSPKEDFRKSALDIFVNLKQIPYLLKVIIEKKEEKDPAIINYLISLFLRIFEKDASIFEPTMDQKNTVEIFCKKIASQSDSNYKKAYILLSLTFSLDCIGCLSFDDFLLVFDTISTSNFLSKLPDQAVEHLLSLILSCNENIEIIESQYSAFAYSLLTILIRSKDRFIEVINRLQSFKAFTSCFPLLIKEISARKLLDISNNTFIAKKELSKKEENDCSSEMEDLDEGDEPINKINYLLFDLSTRLLFRDDPQPSQISIFESFVFSPKILNEIADRAIILIGKAEDNSTSEADEKDKPTVEEKKIPDIQSVCILLYKRLLDVLELLLPRVFRIPYLLPDILFVIQNFCETHKATPECLSDQQALKFIAVISLINSNEKEEKLKLLGKEFEDFEDTLLSYAALGEQTEWTVAATPLMQSRLEMLLNNFGIEVNSGIEYNKIYDLDEADFYSTIVGYYSLPQTDESKPAIDALISMIKSPPTDYSSRLISKSFKFISISVVFKTANELLDLLIKVPTSNAEAKDISLCIASIFEESKWNDDLISAIETKEVIKYLTDILKNGTDVFPEFVRALSQIVIVDKDHAMDNLKMEIIEAIVRNHETITQCQAEIIKIITVLCQTLDFKAAYSDDSTGTRALSHAPYLFDIIDTCIKNKDTLDTTQLVKAISSVCSFYQFAFNYAMSKLVSDDELIRETYSRGIKEFLETNQSPLEIIANNQVTILDLLDQAKKEHLQVKFVKANNPSLYDEFTESIYSNSIAVKLIKDLIDIQMKYELSSGQIKEETFLRGNLFPILLVSSYIRKIYSFCTKNSLAPITTLEIPMDDKKQKNERILAIYNQLKDFIDTLPPEIMKIGYLISTYISESAGKRIAFQSVIFLRSLCYYLTQEKNISEKCISILIMKALALNKVETVKKMLSEQLEMPDDFYFELIRFSNHATDVLYRKAKELYENEGFNGMWFNKKAPIKVSSEFIYKMHFLIDSTLSEKLNEEEEENIRMFMKNVFYLSLESECELQDDNYQMSSNSLYKEYYELNAFAKESNTIKSLAQISMSFNDTEERKWFLIAITLILITSSNKETRKSYIDLLKAELNAFGIECNYQIPSLNDCFSGRVDSMITSISAGIASGNSISATIFLRQFAKASKLLNNINTLSVVMALLPWASAAGVDRNEERTTELFDFVLDYFQDLDNPETWGRSTYAIWEIIGSFSKARKQTPATILINEFTSIFTKCSQSDKAKANLIAKLLIIQLKSNKFKDISFIPSLFHSCIIGTAVYDHPNIRLLLSEVLRIALEIDQCSLLFVEDSKVQGYDCVYRIANIIAENGDQIESHKQQYKQLFLNDVIKSPIYMVSIIGWMFTSIFSDFSDLPEEEDYEAMKEISFVENLGSSKYSADEFEEIMKSRKKMSLIQRLTRLYYIHPKELNDILSLYLKKHAGIHYADITKCTYTIEKSIGDFSTFIVLAFASIGKISFKTLECNTFSELFDESSSTIWDSKALPFFVYLIASRSDLLREFVMNTQQDGKIYELIKAIPNLNICEANIEEHEVNDLLAELHKKGALGFVVNNLIDFAGNNKCAFKKASIVLLTHFFASPKIWLLSKNDILCALWKIYLKVAHNESDYDFADPIKAILKWKIDIGPTSYVYETLILLEQICRIIKLDSAESLASTFDVYDEDEKCIDINAIISRIAEVPVINLFGAIFMFGSEQINESNSSVYNKLFDDWMGTKEFSSVIKEMFLENNSLYVREIVRRKVLSHVQFEAIIAMAHLKSLSEEDATSITANLNGWINEITMSYWCRLVLEMVKSEYLDRKSLLQLLQCFFDQILPVFVQNNVTFSSINESIMKLASELNEQVLKVHENAEISAIVAEIMEGKNLLSNAKTLSIQLSEWTNSNPELADSSEVINKIIQAVAFCTKNYDIYSLLSLEIEEVCVPLISLFDLLVVEKPKSLSEELTIRLFANNVLKFVYSTEKELPEFKSHLVFQILFGLIKSEPGLFLPLVYANSYNYTPRVKESISIIAHVFVKQKFELHSPMLVQILKDNNFDKLFDESLEVEDLIEMITILSSTQAFEQAFKAGEERLMSTSHLSESKSLTKFFTALFCFLLRPLYFNPNVIESIDFGKVNDLLYYTFFSESFFYYFNKLTVSNSIKKELIIECYLKPFSINPAMYLTNPEFVGYPFENLNFNIPDMDEFLESVQRKHPIVAKFRYNDAKKSRLNTINILQKKGVVEEDYISKDEEQWFDVDFRICSEFSIVARLASLHPLAILSFFQKPKPQRPQFEIMINGPSPDIFYETEIFFFWRYTNLIQSESEVPQLCHYLLTRHPNPKVTREKLSFVISKYPGIAVNTLIEGLLDSVLRRNIFSILITRKGREFRTISQMRYIKLLYQLAMLNPGIFSDCGPILVANCILSLSTSLPKWIKYVGGLISQYIDNLEVSCEEQKQKISEKKKALLKELDENGWHFDSIIQASVELFDVIGKDKLSEFVSLFSPLSEFDYKFLYPAVVAAVIKFDELGIASNDNLRTSDKVERIASNIVRNIDCYCYAYETDDGWWCAFTAVIEVLERTMALKCSAKKRQQNAWFSLAFIMDKHQKVRIAELRLLRNCIEKLQKDNQISDDTYLVSGLAHGSLLKLNTEFHKILTDGINGNFLSLFSICISTALGYGDPETVREANEVLKVAWEVWKYNSASSLYVLLPMTSYSTLDVKEVTGKSFDEILRSIIPKLDEFELNFLCAYMRRAAEDMRCPRSLFYRMCPDGMFPVNIGKNIGSKDALHVYTPTPEECVYFFNRMAKIMEVSCGA